MPSWTWSSSGDARVSKVDSRRFELDLTDAALYGDGFPHEVFTALRRHAPVKWQAFPDGFPGDHDEGFWVLSKHEDVQAVSRNPELFNAFDGPQLSHQPAIAGTMLVSMDGRDHVRQRRLISAGFTPRMIKPARAPDPAVGRVDRRSGPAASGSAISCRRSPTSCR